MIGYVTLGTNDIEQSAKFYDELLAVIGAGRIFEGDNFIAWGTGRNSPALSVSVPFDQKAASVGNGTMVAIAVNEPAMVRALHEKALALGGTDEGAPGPRTENFYAGYFRDLDGNKLNAFYMKSD